MISGISELYARRELLLMWTMREIRARYTQSRLGLVWALFQPVVLSLIYVFVALILKIPSDGVPYPIFVYVAQLPWSFFSRGLLGAVPSIVGNMNLVTKIYVPRATFPLATIIAYFVDFVCGIGVLAVMMVFYRIPFTPALPFVFVLLFIQLMLMAGLGLLASALNVFQRDIGQVMPLLLQLATYACPIIYPLSQVPASIRPYYMLNPMAVIIDGYRQVIFKGTLPALQDVMIAAAVSLVALILGYVVFRQKEDQFADII